MKMIYYLPRRSKQPLVPQNLGVWDPRPLHMRARPLHMRAHERLGGSSKWPNLITWLVRSRTSLLFGSQKGTFKLGHELKKLVICLFLSPPTSIQHLPQHTPAWSVPLHRHRSARPSSGPVRVRSGLKMGSMKALKQSSRPGEDEWCGSQYERGWMTPRFLQRFRGSCRGFSRLSPIDSTRWFSGSYGLLCSWSLATSGEVCVSRWMRAQHEFKRLPTRI